MLLFNPHHLHRLRLTDMCNHYQMSFKRNKYIKNFLRYSLDCKLKNIFFQKV